MVTTLSPQSTNHSLYRTEVSMHNISKMYHPKNEHLNATIKTFQYMSAKFIFLYRSMVHEGSQNMQTIKYAMYGGYNFLKRNRRGFCKVNMTNGTCTNYQQNKD